LKRDEKIVSIRPKLNLELNEIDVEVALFMHKTIRPVLKFQHNSICSIIENTQHFNLLKIGEITPSKRLSVFNQFIGKNQSLKNRLIGTTIGLFTTEEIAFYFLNEKALNKRIIDMTITRFLSTIESNH